MALDSGVLPTALANTVARTDFNAAMAQLDAAFPVEKTNLAGDSVVTIKIKDLNVTKAKVELGFGRWVGRDVNGFDFTLVSFTIDGTWKADGLDCSGIVPEGATSIVFGIRTVDDAVGSGFGLRKNATTATLNKTFKVTQVANVQVDWQGRVDCEADRLIDYYGSNLVFTSIDVVILGWYI